MGIGTKASFCSNFLNNAMRLDAEPFLISLSKLSFVTYRFFSSYSTSHFLGSGSTGFGSKRFGSYVGLDVGDGFGAELCAYEDIGGGGWWSLS